MLNKRLLPCCLLILSSVTSLSHADFLDDFETDVRGGIQFLKDRLKGEEKQLTSTKATLPTDLPAHWQLEIVTEPVFNSTIFKLEAGRQHQQTILLVHGLGQTGFRDWMGLIPRLEQQYHVIALDLPGFGHSAKPEGRFTPTNYAEVLHSLVKRYAKGKAIVVGHSMGGAVALRYSATYPEEVSQLILVDAAGILERTAFVKHLASIPVNTENYPRFIVQAVARLQDWSSSILEQSTRIPDPTWILSKSDLAWNGLLSDENNANAALSLIEEDFSSAIKSLTVSTHIIWGGQDRIAPLRTGKMLRGRLANSSMHIFQDAEHVPMRSHKEAFNNHLMQVLANRWFESYQQPQQQASKGDLHCKNEVGKTYRGHYDSIIINHCEAIKLQQVTAKNIMIIESFVEIEDSDFESDKVTFTAHESVIRATNVRFKGKVAIYSSGSRLDLAGVSINATKQGVKITHGSNLIISVSDLTSPIYQGDVHGAFNLSKTTLDRQLKQPF
jgi:pimeloyl-ACP methyl ester carboxylesterase